MAKEFERQGLPAVLISAIPMVPLGAGANRVVKGVRVEHVCGDPRLSDGADRELRRQIVATALQALRTSVGGPTLFDPAAGAGQAGPAGAASLAVGPEAPGRATASGKEPSDAA